MRARTGSPPHPQDKRVYLALWSIAIVVDLVIPVTGLAIATMVALDLLLIRWCRLPASVRVVLTCTDL